MGQIGYRPITRTGSKSKGVAGYARHPFSCSSGDDHRLRSPRDRLRSCSPSRVSPACGYLNTPFPAGSSFFTTSSAPGRTRCGRREAEVVDKESVGSKRTYHVASMVRTLFTIESFTTTVPGTSLTTTARVWRGRDPSRIHRHSRPVTRSSDSRSHHARDPRPHRASRSISGFSLSAGRACIARHRLRRRAGRV